MTDARTTRAGWYPDPKMSGTMRYWDGSEWTDHTAPVAPAPDNKSLNHMIVIVVGILIAAGVIWLVYTMAHANDDLDCSMDNADRALAGQPAEDCG